MMLEHGIFVWHSHFKLLCKYLCMLRDTQRLPGGGLT